MTQVTIASFTVKHLIGPDQEYHKFQSCTPEEFAWKQGRMSEQLLTMDAVVVEFKETGRWPRADHGIPADRHHLPDAQRDTRRQERY